MVASQLGCDPHLTYSVVCIEIDFDAVLQYPIRILFGPPERDKVLSGEVLVPRGVV